MLSLRMVQVVGTFCMKAWCLKVVWFLRDWQLRTARESIAWAKAIRGNRQFNLVLILSRRKQPNLLHLLAAPVRRSKDKAASLVA